MSSDVEIILQLKEYCIEYDVPIENIVEVISDLKVIPMIRGKAFEFAASILLKRTLQGIWKIENPNINPQLGAHDADILVSLPPNAKKIRVECKLTKNDSFRIDDATAHFQVKCMRSRTVSDNSAATRMAQSYGVSRPLLLMHADSYRQSDFDFVLTSLGNAFWKTVWGKYTFSGTLVQFQLLKNLFPDHFNTFQTFQKDAFGFLLYAQSKDIVADRRNNLACHKKKCKDNGTSSNCGFIPNYPRVNLGDVVQNRGPWELLKDIAADFRDFL